MVTLRRLSVFAGALMGATIGLLAVASPASAHYTSVTADAVCTSAGTWRVTWTIGNSEPEPAEVTMVAQDPAVPTSGIAVGSTLPADGTLTATQTVPGDTDSTNLGFRLAWADGFVQAHPKWTHVDLGQDCVQGGLSPAVAFFDSCEYAVRVILRSATATVLTVTGEPRDDRGEPAGPPFNQEVSLAPDQPETVVVPGYIGFIRVFDGETEIASRAGSLFPCLPVEVASRSTCDTFEVSVANPYREPVEARVFGGDFEERVTVAPGETVVVTAPEGVRRLSVEVAGREEDTVNWQRPDGCAPATTPPPGLADTGVRLTSVVALAVALIVVGAVLLVVLRRRRTRTTGMTTVRP
jgi:hypothetical protein